jgi:hypothetical protein
MAEPQEPNEFEAAVQADMMVNSLIRIAKDLEKILVVSYVIAGMLVILAFVALLHAFGVKNI